MTGNFPDERAIMSEKSHADLVRESAEAKLAEFRTNPTAPTARSILRDSEVEGQMRMGGAHVCFQLALTKAEEAVIGDCVAVCTKHNGHHRLRIFRKLGSNRWSQHAFALEVTSGRTGGGGKVGRQQHIYAWVAHVPQPSGQFKLPKGVHLHQPA